MRGHVILRNKILVWNGKVVAILFWGCIVFTFFAAISPDPVLPNALNDNDKLLHVLVFAILTLLARMTFPRFNPVALAVCLALFGALIELAQMIPAVKRQISCYDWLADCLAIIAAMVIFWAFAGLRRSNGRPE